MKNNPASARFRLIAKIDSVVYAAIVGVGVPLMAKLVYDPNWKWTLAAIFFAAGHLYWKIEFKELVVQMKDNREIDRDELSSQKNWILIPFIVGIFVTVVVWLVAFLSFGAWSFYTPAELFIIAHTVWVTWSSYNLIDKLGYDLGTGSPRASRTEHQG